MAMLDTRLYDWLKERDERRFAHAFNAYYAAAYPALMRRLSRLSGWDLAALEEVAQDTLLRFFERAGRLRREASDSVSCCLAELRPLRLGELHVRSVQDWAADLRNFQMAVMSFRPPETEDSAPPKWKSEIRSFAAAIPTLQHRGWALLDTVRHTLGETGEISTNLQTPVATLDVEGREDSLAQFADELSADNDRTLAAETLLPGCRAFVRTVHNINLKLPLLRIPTNGLLFEIALTVYLDECRRRGRLKRGGSITVASRPGDSGDMAEEECLVALYESSALQSESERLYDDGEFAGRTANTHTHNAQADCGAETRFEHHDILARFYEYLRAPLDRALRRCARERPSAAFERRMTRMTRRFDLMMEILTLIGEGYTQVEAAELLGLSRNQVKYVVESVQQSYARFTGDAGVHVAPPVVAGR